MLARWKAAFRNQLVAPARYQWDALRAGLDGAHETLRFLLVTDGGCNTSDFQYDPLRRESDSIRRRFGVVFRPMMLQEAMAMSPAALARFAVVGLKLDFKKTADEAQRIVESFRGKLDGSPTKLVYFDGDDDSCIQWPAVLRASDLYVKKHVFRDLADYGNSYLGKSNLTDYVSRQYGTSFESNLIPRSGVPEAEDLSRLHLGWNIALDDKIANLYQTLQKAPPVEKDNDIVCRATVPPSDWLFPLRDAVRKSLEPLDSRYRVLVPTHRVPQDQYYSEMRRSRICVSPLGYGEICWRDFETILCGCLMIKPEMGHIRTEPDVFIAGETYVPIRWDYGDLVEKCEYYLQHEDERRRIADRAFELLTDYYRSEKFLDNFASQLERLGLRTVSRQAVAAS
jgi:Glycosyl transferases group 1